jgi:hypothetical protein
LNGHAVIDWPFSAKMLYMENEGWGRVIAFIEKNWRISPGLNGVLFLIGMKVLGKNIDNYNKEEKQDLMHIAICTILIKDGYYRLKNKDKEGWPHFKPVKTLPDMSVEQQEGFLKEKVVQYLEQESLI